MVLSELDQRIAPAAARPVALTAGDVGGGLALSDAAGWNQTADDWALFIEAGRAIGIRGPDGLLVATAASLGYGERGWISMVLVAAAARQRGLASALVADCVDALRADGVTPWLDATPAGAAVYGQLGFVAGFAFERWATSGALEGALSVASETASVAAFGPSNLDGVADALERICALDEAASGLDRRVLLAAFLARPGTRAWLSADGRGFVIAREGRHAWQIGPLVAPDEAAALALLASALAGLCGAPGMASAQSPATRIVIDVPSERRTITARLAQRGFAAQRPFVRMALGVAEPPRLHAHSHALAGPEFG